MACHLSGAFEPHHRLLQWHWQEEGRDLARVGPCIAFSLSIHAPACRRRAVAAVPSCCFWRSARRLEPAPPSAAASEKLFILSCLVPPRSPPISLGPSSPDAKGLSYAEKRWRNRVAKARAAEIAADCSRVVRWLSTCMLARRPRAAHVLSLAAAWRPSRPESPLQHSFHALKLQAYR